MNDIENAPKATSMTDPELVVRTGQSKTISARRHRFSRVIVERGGELLVPPRSRNWLILVVSGDVELRGNIVYRGCVATEGGKTFQLPDGSNLSFSHPRTSLGGHGGDGGHWGRVSAARPGKGGVGSQSYGGGGGGGGGAITFRNKQYVNGEDARTFIGGKQYGLAGDGGRLKSNAHGGMICIYCPNGHFDGQSGTVDLRGSDGASGGNARSAGDESLCGGGGGGAPGGDGGYLYVKAREILAERLVRLEPGKGGNPGKKNPLAPSGSDGYRGDDGSYGFVDYF